MKKRKFLVVSPHPDDAELGLGGTIAKLSEQHQVFIVDLTSGEPTPQGSERKRKVETQKASKLLGVRERFNLWLPNRFLADSRENRLLLAEKIRLLKPDILFCPYPEDAHPDHLAATQITEGARFYAKYTKINLIGEPHYPAYIFYYFCSHSRTLPQYSFLVDISETFSAKIKAVRCYRSQFIDNPKNRFIFDYLEAQNRYLGTLIHARYAEPEYVKEAIKINDLASLL